MEYLVFKIHDKLIAAPITSDYDLEATQINKILTVHHRKNKFIKGAINYKGNLINVIDISPLYKKRSLGKFDGLIFVNRRGLSFAIKFEGFFQKKDSIEKGTEKIDIKKIIKLL